MRSTSASFQKKKIVLRPRTVREALERRECPPEPEQEKLSRKAHDTFYPNVNLVSRFFSPSMGIRGTLLKLSGLDWKIRLRV